MRVGPRWGGCGQEAGRTVSGVPPEGPITRRAIVLVDGEHYPPVIRDALVDLAANGTVPVAALVLGGSEKVAAYGAEIDLGVPSTWAPRGEEPGLDVTAAAAALAQLIAEHRPDLIVDRSDEPVLDHRRRFQLAAHVLRLGLHYEGADFRLDPPPRPRIATRPTVAVIGTGKRTGKTAVAGELTRVLMQAGRRAVVVAMGRGGPPEPILVPEGTVLDAETLLAIADAGGHASSDFYEDAVTTGAATVGARRCGGGIAGAVGYSNVGQAVEMANHVAADVTILEGSGAAIPPAHADASLLVVPADCDPEFVRGYLGPYRVLLADLVVVTMCESPRASAEQVEAVVGAIRNISPGSPVLRTVLRPVPLGMVSGSRVFYATTAPASVSSALAAYLEARFGCEVVATSHRLADRPGLRADLETAPAFDVLLVELKAAAVDVAARTAAAVGARMVVCDNRPVAVGVEEDAEAAFARAGMRLADLAVDRFTGRY